LVSASPFSPSERRPSIPSTASSSGSDKKRKPPPPPPKREWVIALYDFEDLNEGDLQFREGDRIKVIRKTDSMVDWWEGELNGTRGAFPANYCRLD